MISHPSPLLLATVSGIPDPFLPDTSPVPPHVRRAIMHALRASLPAFYSSAAWLAGQTISLHETRTGDFTAPCPLPSHPSPETASRPLGTPSRNQARHDRAALALRQETAPGSAARSPQPARPRPLRLFHPDSGGGWRCTTCGQGTAIQFLSRLFSLPAGGGEAAAWNLAARLTGIDPAGVPARLWLPWDVDRAHHEWGTALSYTRAHLDELRPLYQARYPLWRDAEILQFPATGRGTFLAAYRVRGRLTQLEEVDLPGLPHESPRPAGPAPGHAAPGDPRSARRLRYHHWSADRPNRLARSVTGVFPDTLREPGTPSASAPAPRLNAVAHLFQGAEQAASARALLGAFTIGTPYGPLGLGQADVDALARFDQVHVWAANNPAGHGFQNRMVRLLRACGIPACPVQWPGDDSTPRDYTFAQLIRDGGSISPDTDGRLHLHVPDKHYAQMHLPLRETA